MLESATFSKENSVDISIGNALNLQVSVGRIAIFVLTFISMIIILLST